MLRRSFVQGLLGVGAGGLSRAQTPAPAAARGAGRRLAVLLFDGPQPWSFLPLELRPALAELGWDEGRNLSVQWHYAHGDAGRLEALALQLAHSGVDAILTRGTPATRALARATSTVPILTGLGDPVGSGFAKSFAVPGGNITGISYAIRETSRKQLELLRVMVPTLAMLVIVLPADRAPFAGELTRQMLAAAKESELPTRIVMAADSEELRTGLRSSSTSTARAAFVFGFGSTIEPKTLVEIALSSRMPTMFELPVYVSAGGLMSYRLYWENQALRTAAQIDKVFRGEKPAQIPFEQPTRSELVINRSTAKALGLTIAPSLLVRADEIVG